MLKRRFLEKEGTHFDAIAVSQRSSIDKKKNELRTIFLAIAVDAGYPNLS